jgi:hypothetical protein
LVLTTKVRHSIRYGTNIRSMAFGDFPREWKLLENGMPNTHTVRAHVRKSGQAIIGQGALARLKRRRDSKDSSKSASRQPLLSLRKKREKATPAS